MVNGQFRSTIAATGLRRIGIFDSGIGGLTVLQALYHLLPNESILYLADTARLPYGNRTPAEMQRFVREILVWMQQQQVKMVLMACNTSSALVLETLEEGEFPFPILGLIRPGAQAAIRQGRRIGVIATAATVTSNAYRQAITAINPEAQVCQVGCPELVPLIEQNRIQNAYVHQVTAKYLGSLRASQIDTLVYGCTHYPHMASVIMPLLPETVTYIDPAEHMVTTAAQKLDELSLRSNVPAWPTVFVVTGSAAAFARSAIPWLGHTPQVSRIQLPVLMSSS